MKRPIIVQTIGAPTVDSARAVARAFARILEREHPGVRWHVNGVQAGGPVEPASAEPARPVTGGEHGEP